VHIVILGLDGRENDGIGDSCFPHLQIDQCPSQVCQGSPAAMNSRILFGHNETIGP
jgi:hypothetical protein